MQVIVVANEKGGVGKSTIAWNLGVAAALEDGKKVLLVDADPQASLITGRTLREDDLLNAVQLTQKTLHKDIMQFTTYDLIIVDAGGRDTAVFRSAIMAAAGGVLIIPVQPAVYDIWATEETFNILSEMRVYLDIPAGVVLNQVVQNTTMTKEAKETLNELAQQKEVILFDTQLYSRMDYKKSIGEGKGVIEYNKSGKAASEVRLLYSEVKAILDKRQEVK